MREAKAESAARPGEAPPWFRFSLRRLGLITAAVSAVIASIQLVLETAAEWTLAPLQLSVTVLVGLVTKRWIFSAIGVAVVSALGVFLAPVMSWSGEWPPVCLDISVVDAAQNPVEGVEVVLVSEAGRPWSCQIWPCKTDAAGDARFYALDCHFGGRRWYFLGLLELGAQAPRDRLELRREGQLLASLRYSRVVQDLDFGDETQECVSLESLGLKDSGWRYGPRIIPVVPFEIRLDSSY